MQETTREKIIRKLTSRKFWAAVIGFVTQILIAYGVADAQIAQVSAIIMAGATLIAYIVAEGLVDGSSGVININAAEGAGPAIGFEIAQPEEEAEEEEGRLRNIGFKRH